MRFSPLTIRRFKNFQGNKRGMIASIVFLILFFLTLFAEIIANDKPIFLHYNQKVYFPFIEKLPETFFGGEFETEADYKDPFVQNLIRKMVAFLLCHLLSTHMTL